MTNNIPLLPDWVDTSITWRRVVFYFIWVLVHLVLFVYGYILQRDNPLLSTLNSIGYSVYTSRGAGVVLAFDCSILLLPVCRNLLRSVRSTALKKVIPFDQSTYFHKCSAYAMLFFTLVHVNAHYTNFFLVEKKFFSVLETTAWELHYTIVAGYTGHIMLIVMILMYSSAKNQVRKKNFEVFWYIHNIGYFVFYICLFFHGTGCFVSQRDTTDPKIKVKCFPYRSYIYALPGFLLYFIERLVREYRARQDTSLNKVVFHSGNTLELRFEKASFKYKPGQYLFLNIPEVSALQWHPFTITSTPEEGFISVHVRVLGNWTMDVATKLGCFREDNKSSSLQNLPVIRVDGPYGAPAEDLYDYKVACLIGAGIGVTPAASLLKSIWYRYYRKAPMELQKVYFIWLNREKEAFGWFQSLLATLEESVPRSFLEIHVYLTGKLSSDDIQNIVMNDSDALDPLTELSSQTHYGRPNWQTIFTSIKASNSSIKNTTGGGKLDVGVFVCGPTPLANAVNSACKEASVSNFSFTMRKEHF